MVMDIINKDLKKQRDEAMKRFMAAKVRKQEHMARLEKLLRQDFVARTGEDPQFINDW